jgi:pimeloyl-ACP methyl ester carboxylesterase
MTTEAITPAQEKFRRSRIEIPGTLHGEGDLPVGIEVHAKPAKPGEAHRVLVCIHGSHSSSFEFADVVDAMAEGGESVATIDTSRHHMYDPASGQAFEGDSKDYRSSGFAGKTYEMEAEDVRAAIAALLERSQELFGVPPENLRLDILGVSMGANIAAEMAGKFGEKVDGLILASPPAALAADDPARQRPVLDTFPEPERFLAPLGNFPGEVTIIRGADDQAVKESDAAKFAAASAHLKKNVTIAGAGHTFGLFEFGQDEAERNLARLRFRDAVKEALG